MIDAHEIKKYIKVEFAQLERLEHYMLGLMDLYEEMEQIKPYELDAVLLKIKDCEFMIEETKRTIIAYKKQLANLEG